jgi:hypothetical protein
MDAVLAMLCLQDARRKTNIVTSASIREKELETGTEASRVCLLNCRKYRYFSILTASFLCNIYLQHSLEQALIRITS